MNNVNGLILRGQLLGYRSETRQGNNGAYTTHELGVQLDVDNGFGGTQAETWAIRVYQDDAPAVQNAANNLRGKDVEVPIKVGAFAGRNGAIAQLNYDASRPIVPVEATKVSKVA